MSKVHISNNRMSKATITESDKRQKVTTVIFMKPILTCKSRVIYKSEKLKCENDKSDVAKT